jgi:hypothetical protein
MYLYLIWEAAVGFAPVLPQLYQNWDAMSRPVFKNNIFGKKA